MKSGKAKTKALILVICAVLLLAFSGTASAEIIDEENATILEKVTTIDEEFQPDQVNDVETGKSRGCGTPPGGLGSLFQSFTPSVSPLAKVDLRLRAGGGLPDEGYNTTIKIRSDTFDGAVLGTATTFIPGPQVAGTQVWVNFEISPLIEGTPRETYVIEWISPEEGGKVLTWMTAEGDPYPGGTAFGCTGIAIPDEDFIFITYTKVAPLPEVSIETDKPKYWEGETMNVTINISSPANHTFEWYIGIPQFDIWTRVASVPIPAGFDGSYTIPISVGDWGTTSFGIVHYVHLLDPEDNVVVTDVACCDYQTHPLPMGEKTAVDVAEEITKMLERVEWSG